MASEFGIRDKIVDEDECEEGEIKDDDAFEDVSSADETSSLDGRKCRNSFSYKLRHVSPTYGSLSPSRPRDSEVCFRKSRSHYSTSPEGDRNVKLNYRKGTTSDRVHLGSKLTSNPSDRKLHRYTRSHEHYKAPESDNVTVDAVQEKENREDIRENPLNKRSRKRHHSQVKGCEAREFSCNSDNEEKVLRKRKRELTTNKKMKEHMLKSGKKTKDASSKKKNGKGNKEKQNHRKKSHKSIGKRLSMSIIEKSKTIMRNKNFYKAHPQENSLKIRLQAMLGGSVLVKPKGLDDEVASDNSQIHCSKDTGSDDKNVSSELVTTVKDDSSSDEIVEIPREVIEPEVITLDSEDEDRDVNIAGDQVTDHQAVDSVIEDTVQSIKEDVPVSLDVSREVEGKANTDEDDEDLRELRRLALESNKRDSAGHSVETRSIDEDELQLRLEALRSAYLRKHMERKQRGLTVKQKQKSSPIDSPLSSISPSNSPCGVSNAPCYSPETPCVRVTPPVPPPESIPLPPGEEDESIAIVDMELAHTDDERDGLDSPVNFSEDGIGYNNKSDSYRRDNLCSAFTRNDFHESGHFEQCAISGSNRHILLENPKSIDTCSLVETTTATTTITTTTSTTTHTSSSQAPMPSSHEQVKKCMNPSWNVPGYQQFIANDSSTSFGSSDVYKYSEVQGYAAVGTFHHYAVHYSETGTHHSAVPVEFPPRVPPSDFINQTNQTIVKKDACFIPNTMKVSPQEYQVSNENSSLPDVLVPMVTGSIQNTLKSRNTRVNLLNVPLTDTVSGTEVPCTSLSENDSLNDKTNCNFSLNTNVNGSGERDQKLLPHTEDEESKESSSKGDVWTEESQIEAEAIDLSSMIVLDEVGHCSSPERESSVKSGDSNRVGSQHDDVEEDEEVLRARVLDTLSKKQSVSCSNKSSDLVPELAVSKSQKSSRNQSVKSSGNSSWNTRTYQRFITSLKNDNSVRTKSLLRKQRTSGTVSSGTFQNKKINISTARRGSHVVPQTSLQVTIPADSRGTKRRVAERVAVSPTHPQERFVIRVGDDSDSAEEDMFGTRKQRFCFNSSSPSSTPPKTYSPIPVLPHSEFESSPSRPLSSHSQDHVSVPVDFGKKVDLLLKQVRLQEETKTVSRDTVKTGRNLQYKMIKHAASKKFNSSLPHDVSSTPVGIRLLPSSKQEEYRRLKQQLALKEKQKWQQQQQISKRTDGVPGKFRETLDQDRTISISRNSHNIMVNVINDTPLSKALSSDEEWCSTGYSQVKDATLFPRIPPANLVSDKNTDRYGSEYSIPARRNSIPFETDPNSEKLCLKFNSSLDSQQSKENDSSIVLQPSEKEFIKASTNARGTLEIKIGQNPNLPCHELKSDCFSTGDKHKISDISRTSSSAESSSMVGDPCVKNKYKCNEIGARVKDLSSDIHQCEVVSVAHSSDLLDGADSQKNIEDELGKVEQSSDKLGKVEQSSGSKCCATAIVSRTSTEVIEICSDRGVGSKSLRENISNFEKARESTSSYVNKSSEQNLQLELHTEPSEKKVQEIDCDSHVAPNNTSCCKRVGDLNVEAEESMTSPITSQDKLMEYERSLVTQRYSVVDDLTEMMQQLREIELERTTRSECAAEVHRLRAELARAEERLRQQDQLVRKKRVSITEAHRRMMQGRRKCLVLTKSCISVGKEVVGVNYKVPAGGAEIMKTKLQKFAAYTRSAREAKRKEDDFDDKVSATLGDKFSSTPDQDKMITCDSNDANNANCSELTEVPSIQSSLPEKLEITQPCSKISVEHKTPVDSAQKTENIQQDRVESVTNKGEVRQHSHCQFPEYQSPLESLKLKTTECDPQAILCPFELMGSCQDEDCQYSHQPAA
ncbi:serine-rich adhesin for platelets [Anabrus simplex]|uniref:serine-rich adhesin for platelets n=1 Tax=Anabrus simplex TaxID=316456 RepID=UPI0035A34BC2